MARCRFCQKECSSEQAVRGHLLHCPAYRSQPSTAWKSPRVWCCASCWQLLSRHSEVCPCCRAIGRCTRVDLPPPWFVCPACREPAMGNLRSHPCPCGRSDGWVSVDSADDPLFLLAGIRDKTMRLAACGALPSAREVEELHRKSGRFPHGRR